MWEAIAAAAAGAGVGGLIDAGTSIWGARYGNRFSERMRNTQYQASVRDMRAAGLNPILAVGQGGAASPAGAQPGGTSLGDMTATAMEYKTKKEMARNIRADTDKKYEEALKTSLEAQYTARNYKLLEKQINIADEILQQQKANTAQSRIAKDYYQSKTGEIMEWIDKIGRSINPFASGARDMSPYVLPKGK